MKNGKKKILIILVTIILAIMSFSSGSLASEESEWEGRKWESSGNWESLDDDEDYSYYGDYGFHYGRRRARSIFELVLSIIIIITLYIANKERAVKPPPARRRNRLKTGGYEIQESRILAKIKGIDTDFNKEEFIAWSKILFVKLQEACSACDLETIQTLETKELWKQHKAQLQNDLNHHIINIMDNIQVNFAYLCGFRQENGQDIITLELGANMIDYIMNADTGRILRGNRFLEQNNTYFLTFARTTGIKTTPITGETNCPNCGAHSKKITAHTCKYCGSAIATSTNDWLLSGLQKQEKNYE